MFKQFQNIIFVRSKLLKFAVTTITLFSLAISHAWAAQVPRIIIYKSKHPLFMDKICMGHVTAQNKGFPTRVLNFAASDPAFCKDELKDFEQGMYLGLMDDINYNFSSLLKDGKTIQESIKPDQLTSRILSPVPTSQSELDNEQVYIIGVGLNYLKHRNETGDDDILDDDQLLLFPKTVIPSQPYGVIEKGLQLDQEQAKDVILLDYEVELGFVLLNDIDLNESMSKQNLYQQLAYFTSNDLSDRKPIILDIKSGYTQAKTHPGYLPTGPWLIPSRYMPNLFTIATDESLKLNLNVDSDSNMLQRQKSNTDLMIYKPHQVIDILSNKYQSGVRLCMRDAHGIARFLYSEQGIIPAGSLILTGTPGGTAIKEPDLIDQVLLFITGGFTIQGAKEKYVRESEINSKDKGYLQHNDIMYTSISQLGTQRHIIQNSKQRDVYGNVILKADCSYPINKGNTQ